MLTNPRPGTRAVIWYAATKRGPITPHHGQPCTVLAAGRGRPRNHLVELDAGRCVIVPAGNLRKEI